MPCWRFVYRDHSRREDAALLDGRAVLAGTVEEAVAAAGAVPERDNLQTLVVSEGVPDPLPALPLPWWSRIVRERPDGRGWNLEVDTWDHGGWFTSPGSAISYALQRNHANAILALSVLDRVGRTLRIVIHDDRGRATPLYGEASSMVLRGIG